MNNSPVATAQAVAKEAWRTHIKHQASKVSPIARKEYRNIGGVPHAQDIFGNWRPA